jgi:hypothetical protein
MVMGQTAPAEQQLRAHLHDLLQTLEQVESVIAVAVGALEHQNCDRDIDVARVLQRNAGDRISMAIDKTTHLLDHLAATNKPSAKPTTPTSPPKKT